MRSVSFRYHGIKIDVFSDNRKFLDLLSSYHDFLLDDGSSGYSTQIHIDVITTRPIEREYFGTVLYDENSVMTRASGKKMSEVVIDPHTNRVTALLPEPENYVIEAQFDAVFMQPLKYLAKREGISFMHASSVALDEDTGIVFLGDQRAGKSTMAMNMLFDGAYYIAEESPAVTVIDGRPVLYSFPEPIGIGESSLVSFPALQRFCSGSSAPYLKHRIASGTVFPDRVMNECRPAAVFLPQFRAGGSLEFVELDAVDALRAVLDLELDIYGDDFNRPLSQQHMQALGTLVGHVQTYRLFYNDEHLPDIPGRINGLFDLQSS